MREHSLSSYSYIYIHSYPVRYVRIYIYRILILKETGGGDKEQPAGSRYASTMSTEMEIPSCVRGYHVYKDIWAAAVRELLMCSREPRQ